MASERNANQVPSLQVKSNAGNDADVILWADPTTHRLLVDTSVTIDAQFTDDAAFTPGTSKVLVVAGEFDDTTPDSVDEGDAGAVRMSARRELYVQIRDAQGNERGLRVDANGAIAVTGATAGTQYNEDDAHTTGDKVTGAGVVRKDTAASLAGIDGDYTLPIVDANGKLWVNAEVTVALPAGTNAIGKLAANSGVDIGDVDVTSIIPGTGATNLGKAEDAAHTTGDTGVMSLAVRTATPANRSGTDGDYEPLQMSAGRLWVSSTVDAALPAGTNNIGDVDVFSVPAPLSTTGGGTEATALRVTIASDSTGVLSVDDNGGSLTIDGTVTASNTSGDVAHDAVDSGNPVKIGTKAYALDGTEPGTAVAEADRANAISDLYGRPYVEITHPNYWFTSADYAVAQTNASIQAAPGVGKSLYITDITISNGATAGNITLLDGSGGAVKFEIYPAINGGVAVTLRSPIKLTANTALVITSTTVTTHSVNIGGFIA